MAETTAIASPNMAVDPDASTIGYVLREGELLSEVAARFNTDVAAIEAANQPPQDRRGVELTPPPSSP